MTNANINARLLQKLSSLIAFAVVFAIVVSFCITATCVDEKKETTCGVYVAKISIYGNDVTSADALLVLSTITEEISAMHKYPDGITRIVSAQEWSRILHLGRPSAAFSKTAQAALTVAFLLVAAGIFVLVRYVLREQATKGTWDKLPTKKKKAGIDCDEATVTSSIYTTSTTGGRTWGSARTKRDKGRGNTMCRPIPSIDTDEGAQESIYIVEPENDNDFLEEHYAWRSTLNNDMQESLRTDVLSSKSLYKDPLDSFGVDLY
jgi:hypothetical protein